MSTAPTLVSRCVHNPSGFLMHRLRPKQGGGTSTARLALSTVPPLPVRIDYAPDTASVLITTRLSSHFSSEGPF